MSSYRLEFGKRRGKTIRELDNSYLQWLAARDVYVDEDNNNRTAWCERTDSESLQWVRKHHPAAIEAARAHIDDAKLCWHCLGRLVPVGDARANGRDHADWTARVLHKRCWRELF